MVVNNLLDVVFRWAHLIAGIMWIGNSMLFNWLDRNLIQKPGQSRLSQGTIYMVHSGAFYEAEKKLLEPGELPDQLHWFKWQNFATWATGISLLVLVYFLNDAAFLIDPAVRALSPGEAIGIAVGALVGGWAIYDGIWMMLGARSPAVATGLSFALLFGAAYGFTRVFSGRGAFIETGVLMGTVMTGNVWMRILPSQRSLIAATKAGKEQDATLSKRAKQRSIHNNYMTFPLLFIMISNHFNGIGNHANWALLFLILVGGAAVRHFMNIRYDGKPWLVPAMGVGAVTFAGLGLVTTYVQPPQVEVKGEVTYARVQEIIEARCLPCHSKHNTEPMFPIAPKNVIFDTPEHIKGMAQLIRDRVVTQRMMPFINKTNMTEEERAIIGKWVDDGARIK